MPPRRRPEPEQEEQFEDGQQFQPPEPRAPQVNFRNLDTYKFDKLSTFDRPSFLIFARKFRQTKARCIRDAVTAHRIFAGGTQRVPGWPVSLLHPTLTVDVACTA